MNKTLWKLPLYASLLTLALSMELAHARGGAAGGVVAAAAEESIAADQAAEESESRPDSGQSDTILPSTPPTPANPCARPALMNGWYMGIQTGYGAIRVRNSIVTPGASTLTSNLVAAASNWSAGALFGYGTMFNPWAYLGGEIFIVANNFQQNFSSANGPGSIVYTNETLNGPTYGIGILPGIKFNESTLTFARLGWNRVVIKTNETVTGSVSGSTSKTMDGLVLGIGIETLMIYNYSIRGEFDHIFLSSYNTTGPYNTKVSPSSNQYSLALIYHFN